MPGGEKHTSIQNEYIRNADITPNWMILDDICNEYMNELGVIVDFGRCEQWD